MLRSRLVAGILLLVLLAAVLGGSCANEGEQVRPLESVMDKDTSPPELLFFSPPAGDTWVEVWTPIQAVFSEDISVNSIDTESFIITPGVDAERQVCRTASACTVWNELAYSTQYKVSLTNEITDLVGNGFDPGFTWTFLTRDPPPEPVISSIDPAGAPIGAPVVIRGTGFDTTWWANIVWFSNDSADVIGSTDSTITTIVPPDAVTGPVTVENRISVDTSEFDFVVRTLTESPVGRYFGTFARIENFDTDSADISLQYVTVDWFPSKIYIMRLDTLRQPESARIFCDIGGSFELESPGLVLDVDIANYSGHDCDSSLSTAGPYGAEDIDDTLRLVQYISKDREYREFILIQ